MNTSKEQNYNATINVNNLDKQEAINPNELNVLSYSGPASICEGIASGKLGNMAGGFHFNLFEVKWYGTEHLYLCGEWSEEGEKSIEIQNYIRKMPSGVFAKRCSKAKYEDLIRKDFTQFRHQWMLWCVWQKCVLNKDFAALLKSIPEDRVIVEVVKNDLVWAAWPDAEGILRGANAMGKILTICARCLRNNTQQEINTQLLNNAGIYILGKRVTF